MKRGVYWIGGLFVGVLVATAVYDLWEAYRLTVFNIERELAAHARVIAEQTARSFQAVDVQLRYLEQQHRQGALARLSRDELRSFLREQAVGLVQTEGLVLIAPDGALRATSYLSKEQEDATNLSSQDVFRMLGAGRYPGLLVGNARRSSVDEQWMFPTARRLETPGGEFAGIVAARSRIDYFQRFYNDIRLDEGTSIALINRDGTVLVRHPLVEGALGKRIQFSETVAAAVNAAKPVLTRTVSPIDGIDRFVAARPVSDYPLTVFVTRDATVALAPWRELTYKGALRVITLAGLALLLLWLLARQLARVQEARASLEASREQFALAVAGSDDGIWEINFAARRVFNSARGRELIGMPPGPEEMPLEEWMVLLPSYLHPDDVPRRKAAMDAHLEGRTPTYEVEVRHRHPDGSYRWVRIRGVCVRDAEGRPLRMGGSASDIDARRRAEEALRESEQRFALAVAGSNDGIVDWDIVNDRMYSSPRAMEIMGVQSEVTTRRRVEWRELVKYHPADAPKVVEEMVQFLAGNSVMRDATYRVLLPDGSYRWIRHRNKCIRDASGQAIRLSGSVSDIDAQKRAEEERASLEGQLLQAKKLEAIGTLAGGIAHDFNNILSAILGYGEMALKGAKEGTTLRRHIDAVVSAGLRAKSLVERILAFSRSGVGERAAVDVQAVVVEALDMASASLPSNVGLEKNLKAAGAAVIGDPTQIHQVVMNLVANGAQAMRTGGTLTVSLDVVDKAKTMAATSELAAGRYVRLRVHDTGSGIPAEVRERIFDPFFTTKEVGVGTGLGLSMVHGIVTDLGGGIDLESSAREGTTFTVYLPWSDAQAIAARAEEELPLGAGESILLVDDEEPLVRLSEELIASLGYEPVGFTSSAAALAELRAAPGRFHAVLSDESMPGMTGSELAREVRRLRPEIPIVLMSGLVNAALQARARELGVAEVLSKPLISRDIARALAAALRRAPERQYSR